jgi:hypothetical protein
MSCGTPETASIIFLRFHYSFLGGRQIDAAIIKIARRVYYILYNAWFVFLSRVFFEMVLVY